MLLLLSVVVVLFGVKLLKSIASWRKRIRMQSSMLDEKEREIQELKELWHVDPSIIAWDQLLARYLLIPEIH